MPAFLVVGISTWPSAIKRPLPRPPLALSPTAKLPIPTPARTIHWPSRAPNRGATTTQTGIALVPHTIPHTFLASHKPCARHFDRFGARAGGRAAALARLSALAHALVRAQERASSDRGAPALLARSGWAGRAAAPIIQRPGQAPAPAADCFLGPGEHARRGSECRQQYS